MGEIEFERAEQSRFGGIATTARSSKSDTAAGPARPLAQMQDAIHEFDRSQSPQPASDVVEILMKNATVLFKAGEHRLASNILRSVLMRQPDHAGALRIMGDCNREIGRYEDALKCYRALSKNERTPDNQILIADTLYLGERDEMALAAYREALKMVLEDKSVLFDVYKNVGNIHVRLGDFESAEEFYNKAYVINPDSDVLMTNYGTLEIQRENIGEAVSRFRRAVEINPQNDRGWVGLAMVHRHMGDLDLAWANIQRALDINSANRTAIRMLVEWSVQDHKPSVAIERLQEYLAQEGEDAEMSFTLAKIFTYSGRLAEARLEMERVLALDPAIEGADALAKALDREIRGSEQA